MGYKQKHLDAVKDAATSCGSIEEMMQRTGLARHRIYHLAAVQGIDLSTKPAPVPPKRVQRRKRACGSAGLQSMTRHERDLCMIARAAAQESQEVERMLANEYLVKHPSSSIAFEQAVHFYALYRRIEGEQHKYTTKEVVKVTGISAPIVGRLLKSAGLEPFHSSPRWRAALNRGMEYGFEVSRIASLAGSSDGCVTGQFSRHPSIHARWRQARQLCKSGGHFEGLVSALMTRAVRIVEEDGFVGAMMRECVRDGGKPLVRYEQAYHRMREYLGEAGKSGADVPLARRVGLNAGSSLQGGSPSDARALSDDECRAVRRGRFLDASSVDVAYFLNIAAKDVPEVHARLGIARKKRRGIVVGGERVELEYRHACEIFEASDAGFTVDEIVEYSGRPREQVGQVLVHRDEIAKRVVGMLQLLYNNPRIMKPYRSRECFFSDGQ